MTIVIALAAYFIGWKPVWIATGLLLSANVVRFGMRYW